MNDEELEKFKESFIRISKSIIDPNAEKSEYDLEIEFSDQDILSFEEEQELKNSKDESIDRISKTLFFEEE